MDWADPERARVRICGKGIYSSSLIWAEALLVFGITNTFTLVVDAFASFRKIYAETTDGRACSEILTWIYYLADVVSARHTYPSRPA